MSTLLRRLDQTRYDLNVWGALQWQRIAVPIQRAEARRKRALVDKYVGVTGSCGKSTTTHLIHAMLLALGKDSVCNALANDPRFVYRTLRKLGRPTAFVVQEIAGSMGPGRLAPIAQDVRPDVAVITSVGRDHWTTFHSEDAIALEKSALLDGQEENGVACLNADDQRVVAMASKARGRVLLFGTSANADLRAENVSTRWPDRLSFDLVQAGSRVRVTTRFVGTLMLTNVLGALAAIQALGFSPGEAAGALARIEPVHGHMNVQPGPRHTYVLDTEKAPHWSVKLLVSDLERFAPKPFVFVLGQISDTAGSSNKMTRQLLRAAARHADYVIGVAHAAPQAARVAAQDGNPAILAAPTVQDAIRLLADLPPALVMLKGSRVSKMERIALGGTQEVRCTQTSCQLRTNCQRCRHL